MKSVPIFRLVLALLLVTSISIPLSGCLKEWDYEEVKSWYDEQPTTFDEHMAVSRKMVSEGRPDKAEKYLKDAIKLIDSQYGPEDIRIATAADELAILQERTGDFKSAEESYRIALKARTSLPPTSPDLLANKKALASVLMKLYRAEEAEAILSEINGKPSKAADSKSSQKGSSKKADSEHKGSSVHRRKRQIQD